MREGAFSLVLIFHLLGPGERPQRFVPSLITSLLQQKKFLCTHGDQLKDFLDVRDAADAFPQLLSSPLEGAINIGSGRATSLKSIATQIAHLLNLPNFVEFAPATKPGALVADTTRLTQELKWRQQIPID